MNVFISYAREDRSLAQRLSASLNAAGFDSFLDTKDLPPGQEFNAHIKAAVDNADIFIFLASQDSVAPGSYALTELAFAEAKWRNPAGSVLPVVTNDFDPGTLPAYLRPINALQIRGNLEAEVVGWVEERERGGGGTGQPTPEDRLKQWIRSAQPPIGVKRKLPPSSIVMLVIGIGFMSMFADDSIRSLREWNAKNPPGGFLHLGSFPDLFSFIFIGVGLVIIVAALFKAIQGLRGAHPVAAVVLNRESTGRGGISVYLQTVKGERLRLEPVTKAASNTYPGEIGWAYVSGGLLLDFIAGASQSVSASRDGNVSATRQLDE